MSVLACVGLIAATLYSLRILQKVFFGKLNTDWKMNDLSIREKMISISLVIIIFTLGLYPQPVFDIAKPALLKTLENHRTDDILKSVVDKNELIMKSHLFFYQ